MSALALRELLRAFMLLWRILFHAGFVFSREKLWTKMNDTERVLLKLIAKEICMQPTLIRCACRCNLRAPLCLTSPCSVPLTFTWNGVPVTRTFETYEFLEPVSM